MQLHNIYDKNLQQPGYHPVIQSYYYNKFDDHDMKQHSHSRFEIMYVIKGECIVRSKEESIRLLSGDFIFVNSGLSHALTVKNPKGCMVLNIEAVFEKKQSAAPDFEVLYRESPELQSLVDSEDQPAYLRIKDNGEMYRILFSIVEHVDVCKEHDFTLDLWLTQMLLSVARLSGARPAGAPLDYVQAAKDYVNQHFYHEIHVSDIANFIHIHPAYLQRIFKKECGISVVDYLTEVRMRNAYNLLARTNMSIIDIANSVGVNSQQYFTRLFKKTMNVTPKALRDSSMVENREIEPIDTPVEWAWRSGLGATTYESDDADWAGEDHASLKTD